jgi:Family of unknown function (DUF6081)
MVGFKRAPRKIATCCSRPSRWPLVVLPSVGAAAPALPVWDDFSSGFSVGPVGSSARWFYFATPDGAFVGDDGNTFAGGGALTVVPKGTAPGSQLPAYSRTVAQEQISGLPGGLDHVKWLAYMNHLSSSRVPGFDAPLGARMATTQPSRTPSRF